MNSSGWVVVSLGARHGWLLWALTALLPLLASPDARAADEWITLVGGDSRALVPTADGSYKDPTFFVSLTGVSPARLKLKRGAVTSEGKDYSTEPDFGLNHAPDPEDPSTSIVTLKVSKPLPPGKYTIVVVATAPNPPAGEKEPPPATVTLHIVSPAAQVQVASDLYIEAEIPWDEIWSATASGVGHLYVTEATGAGSLTGLKVAPLKPVVIDGRNGKGVLTLDVGAGTIAASRSHAFAVEAEGFELGSSTATLRLTADQLAQPMDIRVQVRAKRHPGVMWFVLLTGLGVGIVLREVLTRVIARGKLAEEADAARNRMLMTLEALTDEKTRRAVQSAIKQLETEVPGAGTGAPTIIKKQLDAVDAAVAALHTRHDAVSNRVDELEKLKNYTAQLPTRLKMAVLQGIIDLREVRALLGSGNVTRAEELTRELEQRLRSVLSAETLFWLTSVRRALARLSAPLQAIEDGAEKISTILEKHANGVQNLASNPEADALMLLKGVHSMRLILSRYVETILTVLLREVRNATDTLEGFPDAAPVLSALRTRLESSQREASVNDGFEPVLERVTAEFEAAWANLLSRVAPGDALKAVKTRIREGDYSGAVDAAVAAASEPKVAVGMGGPSILTPTEALGGPPAESPAGSGARKATDGTPLFFTTTSGGGVGDMIDSIFQGTPSTVLPPRLEPHDTRRAITGGKVARSLQYCIVAVLLATTGYALFAPTFVGTMAEFFAVFMWAFSANIGVEAMLEQSKQIMKPRS